MLKAHFCPNVYFCIIKLLYNLIHFIINKHYFSDWVLSSVRIYGLTNYFYYHLKGHCDQSEKSDDKNINKIF